MKIPFFLFQTKKLNLLVDERISVETIQNEIGLKSAYKHKMNQLGIGCCHRYKVNK